MMKHMEVLKEKILSDRYNALIFQTGEKHGIYLVGGYVRDLLRGVNAQDRDFLVNNDMNTFLRKLRKSIPGKSIVFKKGQVVRFVVRGGMYFDFSPVLGTLKEDLSKRDFSINAIAWSPEEGIFDLHNGITDLRKKTIRALSAKNLISDPLRMLRAYRFAAELNGRTEATTRKIIKAIHYKIKDTSPERITLELFSLLNHVSSVKYMKNAFNDGLLNEILLMNSKTLKNNLQSVSEFEESIRKDTYQKFKEKLKHTYSQNLTYKGLLCLELIVSNSNLTDLEKSRIRISRKILKRLLLYSKGLEWLGKKGGKDKEKMFNLFFHAKESAYDIILTKNMLSRIKDYNRYTEIWKGRQINTDLIKYISGIEEGKMLGNIIYEVRKAEFIREIKTKKDAQRFITEQIKISTC